jgi:hypothetical protein
MMLPGLLNGPGSITYCAVNERDNGRVAGRGLAGNGSV